MSSKPNSITRAIIDSTVERGLREIEEDPKRSIRKLTDMGRLFSKGRFMEEIYSMVQDLLRNDDSSYYTTIEQLLRNTSHKNLKDFGINVGYNGLTVGAKNIREQEEARTFRIPWALVIRIDPTIPDSLTVSEIESCIEQGRELGIYTYIIRLNGSLSILPDLMATAIRNRDCAFFYILPDGVLSASHLEMIRKCTNSIFLFRYDAASCAANIAALKKQKSLSGVYAYYDDEDAAEWYSGNKAAELAGLDCGFSVLISRDGCSIRNGQRVAKYCRSFRVHPEYAYVLFDLVGDIMQVNHTASDVDSYLELMENGDLRTSRTCISDFRHTTSLTQLFSIALPKQN